MSITITPEEKIWGYLRGMACSASSAIDDWSNISFGISEAFNFLSPLSGLEFIPEDTAGLERHLTELEAVAVIADDRLLTIHRYIQKIETTLNQIKEAKNDY